MAEAIKWRLCSFKVPKSSLQTVLVPSFIALSSIFLSTLARTMQAVYPSPRPGADINRETIINDIDASLGRLTDQFHQFVLEERRHRQRHFPPLSALQNNRIAELEARRRATEQKRKEDQMRSETRWREATRSGGPRLYVLRDLERGGYPRHKQLTRLLYLY